MHRTQIMLDDEQYARLREESARSGRSIGDLVRTALDLAYGASQRERLAAIHDAVGAAGADDFDGLDGERYVEASRTGWTNRDAEPGRPG